MSVFFEPWVGDLYWKSSPKVLVLGESHYGNQERNYPRFTIDVVRQMAIEGRGAFFTKITKVLLGKPKQPVSPAEKRALWDRIAFYNYIQELIAEAPRSSRPTQAMWQQARSPFVQVMNRLQPDILVVMGTELGRQVAEFEPDFAATRFCYWPHPSSFVFRQPTAHKAFKEVEALWRCTFGAAEKLTG